MNEQRGTKGRFLVGDDGRRVGKIVMYVSRKEVGFKL
jgi:hypothetical protein